MNTTKPSFWHNGTHTYTKILISILVALGAGLLFSYINILHSDKLSNIVFSWDAFGLTLISFDWVSFYKTPTNHIRKMAAKEYSSRTVIFTIVIIAIFCSILAITPLLTAKNQAPEVKIVHLATSIFAMIVSWLLLHAIFTIKYAHLYYAPNKVDNRGLDFPGREAPDFLDFAYFSYGLGVAFQVSDVSILDRQIRRMALYHSLISFGYNAVIIAMSINILAGLGN